MFAPIHLMRPPRLKRAWALSLTAALMAWAGVRSGVAQTGGSVVTLGGTGVAGYVDGVMGTSQFSDPQGLALRGQDLFIADYGNDVIRVLRLGSTQVRTFVGANRPVDLVFNRSTNLFVANQGDNSITQFDFFGNYRAIFRPALPGGPITALAIDRNDNIYIAQQRGVVSRMRADGAIDASYTAGAGSEFRGVAVLDDGSVFASDAARHVIWRFAGPGAAPTVFAGTLDSAGRTEGEVSFGRFNRPYHIAIGPNNSLVVADRGNHQIRVVSCTGVVSRLFGIDPSRWFDYPSPDIYPGWWDSSAEFAELREPTGIAVSSGGVVYDTEIYYDLVRSASGLAYPGCSTGGGPTPSDEVAATPIILPSSGYYPDGVRIEITASNLLSTFSRDTRLYYTLDGSTPTEDDTEIQLSADGRASVELQGPVDLAGFRVRAFLGTTSSPVVAASPTQVPAPVLSPNSGYYPMGVDVTITSTNGFPAGTLLYYTTDGTVPTTNSVPLAHDGTSAVLNWRQAALDLSSLRVRAFLGPNSGVTVSGQRVSFPGEPLIQGEIGIPPARAGFNAGIGSFYILPVVANLRAQQVLRSLQFVVEVEAGAGSPRLERTDLQVLTMSTNDLIQIRPATLSAPDSTIATARDGLSRLAIAYFGTNSGFNVNGFATVAMLGIQLRSQDALGNTADPGDEYRIRITQVSGTSDGVQTLLPLKPMAERVIRLQNISFLEGDTSPAYWYNAGDFGNGLLENGDVNNAVFAAFGFRLPYYGSDAFAAMDVYRVGVLENVIEFNDAATILRRALGFEPGNFLRSRDTQGNWVQTTGGLSAFGVRTGLRALAAPILAELAWHRDVLIRGGTVQRAQPFQRVSVPVYMKAQAGLTVSGMQFVADIVPGNGAAPISGVQFVPESGVVAPALSGSTVPGLGTLAQTVYARWDNLEPGLTGETLLGYIQFTIPGSAATGQGYAVAFHHAGGATIDPDTGSLRGYLFETMRGHVWINDAVASEARDASDDWKLYFFGGIDVPEANPSLDEDQDGITNLQEYLVGTDPTAPDWTARIENGRFRFRWVGESGKGYTVESTQDFKGWNAVTGQLTGQDAFLEYNELTPSPKAQFYRIKVQ